MIFRRRLRKEDVTKALEWAAAEYKYLEELKRDLAAVDEEERVQREVEVYGPQAEEDAARDDEIMRVKKAVKILRYIGKAERRVYKYEQKVGHGLEELYKTLSKNTNFDFTAKQKVLKKVRSVMKNLAIDSDSLLELTSLYGGSIEDSLHSERFLYELAHRRNPDPNFDPEKTHKQFTSALTMVLKYIDNADAWVKALEASLREAEKFVTDLSDNKAIPLSAEGMKLLREYGFPIDKYPEEAQILARYPTRLEYIATCATSSSRSGAPSTDGIKDIFLYSLPRVSHLITPPLWKQISSLHFPDGLSYMAIVDFYASGLPTLEQFMEEGVDPTQFLTEVQKILYDINKHTFPQFFLQVVVDLHITKDQWPDIVKMTDAAGGEMFLIARSLEEIPLEDLRRDWDDIVRLVIAGGPHASLIFTKVLPQFTDLLGNQVSWRDLVDGMCTTLEKKDLLKLGVQSALLEHYLPDIIPFIARGDVTFSQSLANFEKMMRKSRDKGRSFMKYGLPEILKLVEDQVVTWDQVVASAKLVRRARSIENMFSLFRFMVPLIRGGHLSFEDVLSGLQHLATKSNHFHKFLPKLIPYISRANWIPFALFMKEVNTSHTEFRRLMFILDGADERVYSFLMYLSQFKPKKAADILERYHVISILDPEFEQELALFSKLAVPLTGRARSASISLIMRPWGTLGVAKSTLTKYLNEAVSQRASILGKLSFTEWIVQAGIIDDISSLSFVQMVYIFFKVFAQPQKMEKKIKKIRKTLVKIEKSQRVCLGYAIKTSPKATADRLFKNSSWNSVDQVQSISDQAYFNALARIGTYFFDPIYEFFVESTQLGIKSTMEKWFRVPEIRNPEEKFEDPDFKNAVSLWKRFPDDSTRHPLKKKMKKHTYLLLQAYLMEKTYPFEKDITKSYPYSHKKNKAWARRNLKNEVWLTKFTRTYKITKEDLLKTNVQERMEHHFNDAIQILARLGEVVTERSVENIERLYSKHRDNKEQKNLIEDLKTQLNALKSLEGQTKVTSRVGEKITLEPEFNPLKVLQMGNVVSGSCLSTYGINYWSTIVNAVEINKRVIWAKDHHGRIIGRMLIAIDRKKKIVSFPIYYATNLNLKRLFTLYLQDLADKCKFGLNGKAKQVTNIILDDWYYDSEEDIKADWYFED